jgi:hypothetical protein
LELLPLIRVETERKRELLSLLQWGKRLWLPVLMGYQLPVEVSVAAKRS